jgi:hypothetical protein
MPAPDGAMTGSMPASPIGACRGFRATANPSGPLKAIRRILTGLAAALLIWPLGSSPVLSYGFAGTDAARQTEANYCVSKVAIFGKAPVLDHPDGSNVLYRLALGRCDIRITGACQGRWCQVTFKGGKGWMFRSFLKAGHS